MPKNCKCGGRLHLQYPQSLEAFFATCNKCGTTYSQRKRRSESYKKLLAQYRSQGANV